MYIKDGIAYAGAFADDLAVVSIKALPDMMMLITFSTGETKLYDASQLLNFPAFKPIENTEVFNGAQVEHGIVTWLNGEIDIAPEALYKSSFKYQQAPA
ncbi:MAG: DUF2442 domain-containing protein [Clostridiales bacterium]|jgi:hypothetical protein|nr:DUF2442 domain-containing protein [Clostridiales bacterium]